jgi:prevent-host-death family protein
MKPIDINAAKSQLSKLVERAAAGEEIIIAKAGRPMVRLVPFDETLPRRRIGVLKGKIKVRRDFEDPLPRDVLKAFGVR